MLRSAPTQRAPSCTRQSSSRAFHSYRSDSADGFARRASRNRRSTRGGAQLDVAVQLAQDGFHADSRKPKVAQGGEDLRVGSLCRAWRKRTCGIGRRTRRAARIEQAGAAEADVVRRRGVMRSSRVQRNRRAVGLILQRASRNRPWTLAAASSASARSSRRTALTANSGKPRWRSAE